MTSRSRIALIRLALVGVFALEQVGLAQAAQPPVRSTPAASSKSSVAREVPALASGIAPVCLHAVEGTNGPVLVNLQSVAVIRLDTDIVRFLAANGQVLLASRAYRDDGARAVFEQTVQSYKRCLQAGS